MGSSLLVQRLGAIRNQLIAAYEVGKPLTNESKGTEREVFISTFLSQALPTVYRFGTGDAIDHNGNHSGQLDVVVEYPFSPSLPAVGGSGVRLYPASGIACVLEVKSTLSTQWAQVQKTASKLAPLTREFAAAMTMGKGPGKSVPLLAVGFQGWVSRDELIKKVMMTDGLEGALSIREGFFVSKDLQAYWEGDEALWAFLTIVNQYLVSLQSASINLHAYVTQPLK